MNGRKTGWRARLRRPAAVGSLMLVLAGVFVLASRPAGRNEARAEEKANKEKVRVGPGFSQAILATQLAMQGEKRKSPILMLAAAELVRGLKASDRSAKDAQLQGAEAATSDKDGLTLSVAALADKAKTYAKGDKDLSALVAKHAEQLTSRGLDPTVGGSLPSVRIKDITYKILGGGRVAMDGSARMRNVPFEAGKLAIVAAVGEVSLDNLVVEVHDANGRIIESPPGVKGRFLVAWVPSRAESVTIVVHNGGAEQRVALLANWD